jgi:hypothetical protein
METIRQVLASDLSVRDDLAASILIEQMKHFGLCSVSHCLVVGCADIHNTDLNVGFALPLLMDSSPAVELLVLVIEQLLDDIDLTANEQALSLLFNRAWPSSMCSPYAMERLGAAVMSWIMVEDDVLHFIVKNFASKSKRPPGVRHTPSSAAKGTTAVASYKEDRRRLRQRYARPWLEALYRQDPDAYASLAYERSKMIDNRYEVVELAKGEGAASQMAGIALERITSFVDAEVMFEASLDLLTAWLEDLGGIAHNVSSMLQVAAIADVSGHGLQVATPPVALRKHQRRFGIYGSLGARIVNQCGWTSGLAPCFPLAPRFGDLGCGRPLVYHQEHCRYSVGRRCARRGSI